MGAWLRAPPELIGCTNVVVDKRGVFGRGCGDAKQEGRSVAVMTRSLPPKVMFAVWEGGGNSGGESHTFYFVFLGSFSSFFMTLCVFFGAFFSFSFYLFHFFT